MILKCKMCGGDVELSNDKTLGTCEHCGNTMTFPKIDDEQRVILFNRGNHFRRIGEFDKALSVYESIVAENEKDSEAHWCCALSRFGIEYVEDPATFEWLPTCHRASFDSFLEDVDYLAAVEYSDGVTQRQYQKDAAKIAEVQKGILLTSQNEEPFDIFICYKESDKNGERTIDSTLAQEIYYQLVDQGYRVFFARITLEDKVGTQYEPFIFAALNSAKVMITVGTKPEYYNAVWVKNEWSRFLALMKRDRSRLLLPCYRDMDPYDLPDALSILQSYDMSKIGFIQDLIRGIKKIIPLQQKEGVVSVVEEKVVVQQENSNKNNIIKRGFMALEDEKWDRAQNFFEQALDIDPKWSKAYLGEVMCELKIRNIEQLVEKYTFVHEAVDRRQQKRLKFSEIQMRQLNKMKDEAVIPYYLERKAIDAEIVIIDQYESETQYWKAKYYEVQKMLFENRNYARALEFCEGDELAETNVVHDRIVKFYEEGIYNAEQDVMKNMLEICHKFVDTMEQAPATIKRLQKGAFAKQEKDYTDAVRRMGFATEADAFNSLGSTFGKLGDYKDSRELFLQCMRKQDQLERISKLKKFAIVAIAIAVVLVVGLILKISNSDLFYGYIFIVPGIVLLALYLFIKTKDVQPMTNEEHEAFQIIMDTYSKIRDGNPILDESLKMNNYSNTNENEMAIEFTDLLDNGLFKSTDAILAMIDSADDKEEISISNIPFVPDNLIVYMLKPILATRSEPEFHFKDEDAPAASVKYIVCSTRDVTTGREGIIILNTSNIETVLEAKFTDVITMGDRIYCGLIKDKVVKMSVIQRTDILDFTDYFTVEIADVGSFSVDGVKPTENSQKYIFYIVEGHMEDENGDEYSEFFVLQSNMDILRFVDGLVSLADEDMELVDSYMQLKEWLERDLAV